MSKSYGNAIEIFAEEATLRKKVMSIVTDTTPIDEPKPIEGNALFEIYATFLNEEERAELKERFLTPGLKYGEVKKELFELIWEYFAPYREKRQVYASDREEVARILKKGAGKARETASYYMDLARKRVGLNY